jgi:preprotein translocase subunit SecE
LAALHHDPESDRSATRNTMVVVLAVAAAFAVLSIVLGVDGVIVNPVGR